MDFSNLCISEFKDDYYFLDNAYQCCIIMNIVDMDIRIQRPVKFMSAEAAYQYGKAYFASNKKLMEAIRNSKTHKEAIAFGKQVKFSDKTLWHNFRFKWMYKVLENKFLQNYNLQISLFKTFPKFLIYTHTKSDTYWGFSLKQEVGENTLGLILMILRNRLLAGLNSNILNYNINV